MPTFFHSNLTEKECMFFTIQMNNIMPELQLHHLIKQNLIHDTWVLVV